MKITINYFGQLRQAAAVDSETIEIPDDSTIKKALKTRADHYGQSFEKVVLDEQGNIRPSVLVVVNGKGVDVQSLPAIGDGDEITFMPAIAGG